MSAILVSILIEMSVYANSTGSNKTLRYVASGLSLQFEIICKFNKFAALFNCTPVDRASDSMMAPT